MAGPRSGPLPPIERVSAPEAGELLPGLIALLQDAVASGASLGFLAPLSTADAEAYWRHALDEVARGMRIVLVARQAGQVAGMVHLVLAPQANAPHRAEVQKLCVLRRFRGQGLGPALMRAVEDAARAAGRTLLVLDTRRGDPAERLYARLGYTAAGVIPQFTREADGTLHDTVVFYRII